MRSLPQLECPHPLGVTEWFDEYENNWHHQLSTLLNIYQQFWTDLSEKACHCHHLPIAFGRMNFCVSSRFPVIWSWWTNGLTKKCYVAFSPQFAICLYFQLYVLMMTYFCCFKWCLNTRSSTVYWKRNEGIRVTKGLMYLILTALLSMSMIIMTGCMCQVHSACAWIIDPYIIYITVWDIMTKYLFPFLIWWQIFPGLILSDIKPAKKMKFKTVCYLLVQLMHCRKMFKAEIPFSNVMNCEDGDKV